MHLEDSQESTQSVNQRAAGKLDDSKLIKEPFKIKDGLIDESKTNIGLDKIPGAETCTIFSAAEGTDHYVNGIVMTEFKGKLYCQWQSSQKDEDAPDTWVAYSVSEDGKTWSAPKVLAPTMENGYRSSGGWNVCGDKLIAYVNAWPDAISPRGGLAYYTESTDGENWSELKPVLMKDGTPMQGIIEQDPHKLASGRIVDAAHFQPGLFANPIYTDDPTGTTGWVRAKYTNMPYTGTTSREMEPSLFVNEDGNIIMTFRDQDSSFHRLASVSTDNGESWSTPVLTNMPDSRAKQSAGNLPDETAYLVGNSVTNKLRIPLTIALSADGKTFDHSYVLRTQSDIPELQYTGKAKRLGYHYPKSAVLGDYLYVSYATNKEHVDYTRIPLSAISLNPDVQAPVIDGIKDGGVYTGNVTFTVSDKHLKSVTVNGKELLPVNGVYTLTASDVDQVVVVTDESGNKTTFTVKVNKETKEPATNPDKTNTPEQNNGAETVAPENSTDNYADTQAPSGDQTNTSDSPATGDQSMMPLYLGLSVGSVVVLAVVGLAIWMRKKRV